MNFFLEFRRILSEDKAAVVMGISAILLFVVRGDQVLALSLLGLFAIAGSTILYTYLQGSNSKILRDTMRAKKFFDQRRDESSRQGTAGQVNSALTVALSQIRAVWDGTIFRMNGQIEDLGKRANTNLWLGALISLLGFAVLAYFVFFEVGKSATDHITFDFIVRLSLVLFVEAFAYFFLNLYRAGLQDIKYFQNEMTNATFLFSAIEIAFASGKESELQAIWKDLLKIERNFVIKKTETTHDLRQAEMLLEAERGHAQGMQKILDSVLAKFSK